MIEPLIEVSGFMREASVVNWKKVASGAFFGHQLVAAGKKRGFLPAAQCHPLIAQVIVLSSLGPRQRV